MRIECRIENDGKPILFFPDDKNLMIPCYHGEHSEATRAYMRSCKKPVIESDHAKISRLLTAWAQLGLP